jgi:glucose/arabinose dehydrogenase
VGPDGKLYISLGQPFNVQPREKVAAYDRLGIGGIIRMNAFDGSGREVFARGIRNSVGQDFNPKDGTLWWTDNQVDGMGDDIPPGELNRSTKAGEHFGFPWTNGGVQIAGSSAAPDLKDLPAPAGMIAPQVNFPAHQAQLGMAFASPVVDHKVDEAISPEGLQKLLADIQKQNGNKDNFAAVEQLKTIKWRLIDYRK